MLARLFLIACCLCVVSPGHADDPLRVMASLSSPTGRPLPGQVVQSPCAQRLPDTPLTAVEAVDLALCNHPRTREVWANARSQAALVGVGEAAWWPRVDARASETRIFNRGEAYDQRTLGLNASWLLFDAGARAANLEAAQRLLDAAQASRDSTLQALFFTALQTYYVAQAAQAAVRAAELTERAAQEAAQAAALRYQVGVTTPADRLQATTAYSQSVLNRVRANGTLRTALGALANALGFDAYAPITLAQEDELRPDLAWKADVEALVSEARRRRPDLVAAEAQWLAARASVGAVSAAGKPTLSVTATPTWQQSAGVHSDGGALGLTLNVPLFYGFETHYRTRAAEAVAEARQAQREQLSSQIALDVWRSYQSLQTALQALLATQDLLTSAEASEQMALGRYKAGVGQILDLLNAQAALAGARAQRIQAVFDWRLARAALAQAMGSLDYRLLENGEGTR